MEHLNPRQLITSTCGYLNGDANQPRTANAGYDCTIWTQQALWGFCPTTVDTASDCGLAGNCVDAHGCSTGCGITGTPGITTFTCTGSGNDYCSTALLTAGPGQVYSYLACADAPSTAHYFVEVVTTPVTQPSSTSTSSVLAAATSTSSFSSIVSNTSPISLSTNISTSIASSTSASSSLSSSLSSSFSSTFSSSSSLVLLNATTAPNPSFPTSINLGEIIGGALGGLALIFVFILALVYLWRRGKADRGSLLLGSGDPLGTSQTPWRGFDSSHYHNPFNPHNGDAKKYTYQKQDKPIELSTYAEPQEVP